MNWEGFTLRGRLSLRWRLRLAVWRVKEWAWRRSIAARRRSAMEPGRDDMVASSTNIGVVCRCGAQVRVGISPRPLAGGDIVPAGLAGRPGWKHRCPTCREVLTGLAVKPLRGRVVDSEIIERREA